MSLSPQWLDELRARISLSTLIGKTVKVQKAGREYKACCPFHNEKTPSFTINDEKGFYHCFGCGAHGDAIRWMTDNRGLPFMEAVKELALSAGLEVPAADPRAARRAEQAKGLHDAMQAASDWFSAQLAGTDGGEARDYLKRRGISEQTQRIFGFGYAPDSRGRLKAALRDFGEPMLVEAGMLIDPDGGEAEGKQKRESYDRFRGRLMIPIRDQRGRVIAFGGRILGAGEPKYLNSPDTPLFDKGRTLYNIDRAAPASRQTGRVIVVEGYMDVIALAQAGFGEAVAPLGTALTEHQIERLWKMVEVPILCFDGDAAGQKAAIRAAMRALPLLRPGHSLAFATLPQGQDPDDLVRESGAAGFEAVLARAEPLVDRLWNHAVSAGPLDTPEQKAGLKQRLSEYSAAIQHPDVRAHYAQAFRERHDAMFFAPRARAPFTPRQPRSAQGGQRGAWKPPIPPATAEAHVIRDSGMQGMLMRGVLAGLMLWPDQIKAHLEELMALRFADSSAARLMEMLIGIGMREETVETEGLLTILGQGDVYNMAKGLLRADALTFTFTRKKADPDRARRDLTEAIRVMAAGPEIDAALAQATARMKETVDEASFDHQRKLLLMRADHQRRLADLMQPEET